MCVCLAPCFRPSGTRRAPKNSCGGTLAGLPLCGCCTVSHAQAPPKQAVEFDQAINYVNKIKTRCASLWKKEGLAGTR